MNCGSSDYLRSPDTLRPTRPRTRTTTDGGLPVHAARRLDKCSSSAQRLVALLRPQAVSRSHLLAAESNPPHAANMAAFLQDVHQFHNLCRDVRSYSTKWTERSMYSLMRRKSPSAVMSVPLHCMAVAAMSTSVGLTLRPLDLQVL